MRDGKSDAEIHAFMTERYGDFVLLRPPVTPRTWLLWAAPALFLAGGLAVVLVVVRRRASAARSNPAFARRRTGPPVTAFIAICAVFIAAAIGLVAWPLLRRGVSGDDAPRAGIAAAVVAAALPVAAFLIYFSLSNWDWRAPVEAPPHAAPDLQRVVAELQERLSSQPGDVEGWKLLGRSATVLGDYPLARRAFGEAYTRTEGADADAVVGYAESMVLMDEREIDGEAARLFERALEMAPDNARALWYGGIVAYRRGDMALAQQRWIELQDHDLPADLRQVLAERLAELEQSQGKPAAKAERPRRRRDRPDCRHRSDPRGPRPRERDAVRDRAPRQRRPAARRAATSGRRLAGLAAPQRRRRHAARHHARGRRAAHAHRADFRERAADRGQRRPLRRGQL